MVPDNLTSILYMYSIVFEVENTLTDSRNSSDNFAKLELVKNGGFTGSIETDHQDPHLLLAEEIPEQVAEYVSHC